MSSLLHTPGWGALPTLQCLRGIWLDGVTHSLNHSCYTCSENQEQIRQPFPDTAMVARYQVKSSDKQQ